VAKVMKVVELTFHLVDDVALCPQDVPSHFLNPHLLNKKLRSLWSPDDMAFGCVDDVALCTRNVASHLLNSHMLDPQLSCKGL